MALKRRLPSSNRPPPANHLLAALPAAEYARLAPTLRNTPLKLKRFLHNPGDPIDRVYFPGGGSFQWSRSSEMAPWWRL